MSINVSEKNQLITRNFELINAIRRYPAIEKKQLAKILGLSWPTLNNMLTELVNSPTSPVIQEKNSVYSIKPDFGYFVGIAVGGSETKVAILDMKLKPVEFSEYPLFKKIKEALRNLDTSKTFLYEKVLACFETPQYPQELSLLCNQVLSVIIDSFKNASLDLLGIGFTFPGIFGGGQNNDIFKMSFCPNLSRLVGFPLIDLIDKRILEMLRNNEISFIISHDTDAVTVFEKENLYDKTNTLNDYCDKPNCACIYLGVGLGMGLIINNTLIQGACHSVGEIGHLIAPPLTMYENQFTKDEFEIVKNIMETPSQSSCYCGVKNCLEHELRTKVFMSESNNEFLNKTTDTSLKNFDINNPIRYKILKQYISYLMNLLINILNVDIIIFAGRIFNKIPSLKYDIELIKLSSGLASAANTCRVAFGMDRADVVALGGAAMSYHNLKQEKIINYNANKNVEIIWPKLS